MAGRGQRVKGRLREAAGALADNKQAKDKGRLDQLIGSARKKARKGKRKVS